MKPRLLLIDDELQWLKSFKQFLDRDGYDVITATNIRDAVQVLDKIPDVRVVLADLMLPEEIGDRPTGRAGVRLLELIRTKRPDLPIIVVSGYLEPHSKELSQLGVSNYVNKGDPDSIDLIGSAIRRAIQQPQLKTGEEIDPPSLLMNVRSLLVEEIDKYSAVRERTVHIPDGGSYELIKPLIGFKRDIERQLVQFSFGKNVFLMMKFRQSNRELAEYIIETLADHGLRGVRADHEQWNITRNVYNPIAVLYCCKYGIALFDEPEENQAYSPNVAYELGMMHYQNKECLILRNSSLPVMPFDLIKDLYWTYDRDLQVRGIIANWVRQVAAEAETSLS
jgi:CheY-like chemotaxis protein